MRVLRWEESQKCQQFIRDIFRTRTPQHNRLVTMVTIMSWVAICVRMLAGQCCGTAKKKTDSLSRMLSDNTQCLHVRSYKSPKEWTCKQGNDFAVVEHKRWYYNNEASLQVRVSTGSHNIKSHQECVFRKSLDREKVVALPMSTRIAKWPTTD